MVGRSTRVTAEANVTVAGQAAYQLVLAPKASRSLIGKVAIALDAQHLSVPLRVQVFAKGTASPVFQVGYTSISFVTPAASNFNFTPPPGATVNTEAWACRRLDRLRARPGAPGHDLRGPGHRQGLDRGGRPARGGRPSRRRAVAGVRRGQCAAGVAGQAARSVSGGGGAISGSAMLGALLLAAHPVHGAWGSGRLLHTSLVSMLITNGHVLIGAVTPSVLYADVAQVK